MNSQLSTPGQSRLLELLEQWGLPKEAIAGLVGRHTLVRYPKRSPLFLQGSPADVAFAVFNGLVKVYCPGADGNRILVYLAGPGDLIGYADFMDTNRQRSQMFEAHALTSCSVALFTRQHVLKVLKDLDQGVLLKMVETLNGFWSSMVHRYAVYLSMSLRERLQFVLADLGSRFGVQEARGVLLTPELAQEELAEMIGSSRPMVSKLLGEMAERSMIPARAAAISCCAARVWTCPRAGCCRSWPSSRRIGRPRMTPIVQAGPRRCARPIIPQRIIPRRIITKIMRRAPGASTDAPSAPPACISSRVGSVGRASPPRPF
jgi:CRP/FNR family transcriptional regulator, cyclic AMP receptor protein